MSSSASKFILNHPNVAKIVKKSSSIMQNSTISASRNIISQISPEQENQIILKIKQKQTSKINQLKEQLNEKIQKNKLYAYSLSNYRPDQALKALQQQLTKVLTENSQINSQILNCQIVQKNTTPEEYYLFKKKQRMDSFHESIDQLYRQVQQQKNQYNTFMTNCKKEMQILTEEIKQLQQNMKKPEKSIRSRRNQTIKHKKTLSKHSDKKNQLKKNQFKEVEEDQNSIMQQMKIDDDNDDDMQYGQYIASKKQQQSNIGFSLFQMPKLEFSLRDNVFTKQGQNQPKSPTLDQSSSVATPTSLKRKLQNSATKLNSMKIPLTQSVNRHFQKQSEIKQQESPMQSSVDQEEYYMLKQEYANLLSTVQILQQNKQILTFQLYDRVININQSLNNFFQSEKTKIFKEIKDIKADLSDPKKFANPSNMGVIQPTQSELSYNIKPLILDYQNKMTQIGKRLTPQLRQVSKQLLFPLNWPSLNVQSYFQKEVVNGIKQPSLSKEEQIAKLQQQSKQLQQQIKSYEASFKEVMEQTVTFKQKQHELQMAMNNMRKMLQ